VSGLSAPGSEARTWNNFACESPIWPVKLVLLVLLATLWGASYSFIKLGVATVPPIILIAARTLVPGTVLLAIMHWRGRRLPKDAATWRRFLFRPASTA
jgi:drug/metabolite transporter (DMT)-like permease